MTVVALGIATLGVLSLVPIPDGPARLGLPALSLGAPSVPSPGGLALPDGSAPPADAGSSERNPDRGSIGNVVGYPGFSEQLDTSVRGELGDQIVMRVRAPEPAFWRGQTFSEFDGRTWTVSPDLGRRQDGPVIDVQPTMGDAIGSAVPSRELVQTYFIEQDLPNVVFAAVATGAGDLRRIAVDPAGQRTALGRHAHRRLRVHGDLRTSAGRRRHPAGPGRPRRVLPGVPRDGGR